MGAPKQYKQSRWGNRGEPRQPPRPRSFLRPVRRVFPAPQASFREPGKLRTSKAAQWKSLFYSADGIATADRSGKAMNGTWKEEDDAAVISWTTGWKTKIIKQGDHYKKTAYKDRKLGTEVAAEAEKVK